MVHEKRKEPEANVLNTKYNEKAGKKELHFSLKRVIVRFFGFALSLAMMLSCSSAGRVFAAGENAAIGDNAYAKIGEAIDAAGENDIVKLLPKADGSPFRGFYTVSGKKNITIDLNGAEIEYSGENNYLLKIENSSVTIKNGTLNMRSTGSAGSAVNAVTISGSSDVVFEDVKIKSAEIGILVDGTGDSYIKVNSDTVIDSKNQSFYFGSEDTSGNVTLDIFGKINSEATAIFSNSKGKVKINLHSGSEIKASATGIWNKESGFSLEMDGGLISGWTGIYSAGGKLTIRGGHIEATGDAAEAPNTGCAVSSKDASLKIIGGEFYSSNADAVGGEYSNISVVGGSFFPEVPTKGIVKSAVFTDEIINGTTYKVISYATDGEAYKIANPAVQIAMLEPWGVRVSAAVTKDGAAISPDDYATENIRCGVWFAIGEEKYTSAEEIKNAAGSQYISGKADTDGFLCDYRGIYIYDFGKYISMTIELDTGDDKLYSKTISYSMLELIELRLGADDCLGAEKDLLKYMVDYYGYVDAYSKGN